MTHQHPTHTLVDVGTHSLALYAHGPEPSPDQPVVIFVSGIASSQLNWAAVIRSLPSSLRSYTYDRAGYGNSSLSPHAPTAENIAVDLSNLIKTAPISNPTILVGHSWAGVLINEYIAFTGGAGIAGLVLVDANHETVLQVLDPNDANLAAISLGIEQYSAKGIEAEHKLTKSEWDAFIHDESTEDYMLQAIKEGNEYVPSFDTLRQKQLSKRQPLLGDKPVYVIGGSRSRDWTGMYKAGIARGNGTEEQRSYVREMIRTANEKSAGLMKEHLKLSTNGKLVFARASGHFVQLTEPELVVEGVNWVLEQLKTSA